MPVVIYRVLIMIANFLFFYNYLDIPKEKMNSKNLVACNIITKKINNGSMVYLKDKIIKCINNNVILENNILLNIDSIILATGFDENVSFLKEYNNIKYLQMFDTNIENCAFIGFSPSYNWPKISEKQSKLFIKYILGDFEIKTKNIDNYIKKHTTNQNINNLKFTDLTYELYNY